MEQDSLKWFFGDISQTLAWGEPFWPEIAVAIATIMCILWLIMRLTRETSEGSAEQSEEPTE